MKRKFVSFALVLACSFFSAWGQLDEDTPTAAVVIHDLSVEGNVIAGQVTVTNLTELMLDGDVIIVLFRTNQLDQFQQISLRNLGIVWLEEDESETLDFSIEVTTPESAFTRIFTRRALPLISGDFMALAFYTVEVDHGPTLPNQPAGVYHFSVDRTTGLVGGF